MTLTATPDGRLTGVYHSTIGKVTRDYQLVGFWDPKTVNNPTVSWTVLWQNESVSVAASTSWNGFLSDGKITAFWVSTASPPTANDLWKATSLGRDEFRSV